MNIIKYPEHQCSKCGCVYSFDKEDFKTEEKYVGEYQQHGFSRPKNIYNDNVFVLCPICGKKYIINSERKEK